MYMEKAGQMMDMGSYDFLNVIRNFVFLYTTQIISKEVHPSVNPLC